MVRIRRLVGVVFLVVPVLAACGDGDAGGGQERSVLVDYRNDDFASHYWKFFPSTVAAHPGDTIVFRQQWTGEPHTVTMGSLVEEGLDKVAAVEEKYKDLDDDADPALLAQAEAEYFAATRLLPELDPYLDTDKSQNGLQPCYLDAGSPPAEPNEPCVEAQQRQPAFTGRQSFYNSGFIPFEGKDGNRFRVRLSSDIAPGEYRFVCLLHPSMEGAVDVRPTGDALPSGSQRNRRTRTEIETFASPLRRAFADMRSGAPKYGDQVLRIPIAGYHSGDEYGVVVDEFVPKTIRTTVGKPVTWTVVGGHTVSFDVPKYLPIFTVDGDGRVRRNPDVDEPRGGSPPIPAIDFESGPFRIDGGTWDGDGFFSSGLLGSEPYSTYTLRFSEPGRYRYACLIHPPMVGTVVVGEV